VIAVIFEVLPAAGRRQEYLDTAAALAEQLRQMPGFVSVERYASLAEPGKLLSLSFWADEDSVRTWRNLEAHRQAQSAGRRGVFADYRLRVAEVLRDYGLRERLQAPGDSQLRHPG